jgi:hypothetical protein
VLIFDRIFLRRRFIYFCKISILQEEKTTKKAYKKIGLLIELMVIFPTFSSLLFISPFHAVESQQQLVSELLSYLEPGDILFMDLNPPNYVIVNIPQANIVSNDHCAMFVGIRPNFEGDDWCIHAGDPVQYTRLDGPGGFATWATNFSIYRVWTANQTQKDAAIEWERARAAQVPKCEYQHWSNGRIRKDWDNVYDDSRFSVKNKFYCSELHWAAYYNTSGKTIDIDCNGNGIRPWLFAPCVNMGVPVHRFGFLVLFRPFVDYAFQNEIKLDDDVHKIYPLS